MIARHLVATLASVLLAARRLEDRLAD